MLKEIGRADREPLLLIPLSEALTFGETADRAVAPRAIEAAVGPAIEDERREFGNLAVDVAISMTVQEEDSISPGSIS